MIKSRDWCIISRLKYPVYGKRQVPHAPVFHFSVCGRNTPGLGCLTPHLTTCKCDQWSHLPWLGGLTWLKYPLVFSLPSGLTLRGVATMFIIMVMRMLRNINTAVIVEIWKPFAGRHCVSDVGPNCFLGAFIDAWRISAKIKLGIKGYDLLRGGIAWVMLSPTFLKSSLILGMQFAKINTDRKRFDLLRDGIA